MKEQALYEYILALYLQGTNIEVIKSLTRLHGVNDEDIEELLQKARVYKQNHEEVNKPVTDPNTFMKVLISCGISYDMLKDYHWSVKEIRRHEYQCTGVHPVAARFDVFKRNVFIH